MLRLATLNGAQITPVWTCPRYIADTYGCVQDQAAPRGRPLTIPEAEAISAKLDAQVAKAIGTPLWHAIAPEAVSLGRAIKQARLNHHKPEPARWWPFNLRGTA